MKMEAILSLKKLDKIIMQENSEEDAKQKIKTEWETKNKEAAYIYLLVGRTSTVYNGKRNVAQNQKRIRWSDQKENQKIDAI